MVFLPLTFLTLTLTLFGVPGVSSTSYTMRPSQRLADGPLMSLTFNESEGSFTRCVVACRSKAGCFSVNVHVDRLTSLVTCELLGVYLHGAVNRLTSAADWTFIQEDPVYTDESWALAFRASSAVGISVWDTWHQDGRHDDPKEMEGCVLPASSFPCTTHFRSYILDHWSNMDQVRVSLFKDAEVVASVTFDGQGSNRTSWFDVSRIVMSSWTDLTASSAANYFSIDGSSQLNRRFFMNTAYSHCPGDSGWMMVADVVTATGSGGWCAWEKTQPTRPAILYSPLSTTAVWETSLAVADFMMVHVTFL